MLGNKYFYPGLYKKWISLFGTLFNEIHVEREDDTGKRIDDILVPITFAPKDKILARLIADPGIDKEAAIVLPRLSFEIVSMEFDHSRMLNSVGFICEKNPSSPDKGLLTYNPIPFNIGLSLFVYVKNENDGTKILEQILPYFKPEFTVSAHLIPEMNKLSAIPIIFTGITRTDTYDGSFKDRRALIWQLNFTMKVNFYGATIPRPIIKFVETTFFDGSNNAVSRVTVQPGLTANGEPTSNSAQSINPHLIVSTDHWGLVEIIEDPLR